MYYLDGKEIEWRALILKAEAEGYDGHGVSSTSQAAAFLRDAGHTVSDRPPKENEEV